MSITRNSLARLFSLTFVLSASLYAQGTPAQTVRFHTNLGDIDVNLVPSAAPKTVANFMNYVNRGDYSNSIFHRSVPGFIIQGGGYGVGSQGLYQIGQDAPVQNEFSVSNTRGTIAMAKLGSDPNSATNQWFFNLANNASQLDTQNGGFTVFGRVANASSLAVMDKIAAAPVYDLSSLFGSPFTNTPLINVSGTTLQPQNFITVLSITVIATGPSITANGIITASAFGAYPSATAGSFIEIYGTNLAGTTRSWTGSDFSNGNAPTTLDKVSVSVCGHAAYVYFVSAAQVNVQVPASVPASGTCPVIVTYNGLASASGSLAITATDPGLLAPASFKVGDKQFVASLHSSSGAFVSKGIPDVPDNPAAPGETLLFYGVGFGPVTPDASAIAGHIVTAQEILTNRVEFDFGTSPGTVIYQGLAPNLVGLYQFNVTVPADAQNGDLPLTVKQNGSPIAQTLYISVQSK